LPVRPPPLAAAAAAAAPVNDEIGDEGGSLNLKQQAALPLAVRDAIKELSREAGDIASLGLLGDAGVAAFNAASEQRSVALLALALAAAAKGGDALLAVQSAAAGVGAGAGAAPSEAGAAPSGAGRAAAAAAAASAAAAAATKRVADELAMKERARGLRAAASAATRRRAAAEDRASKAIAKEAAADGAYAAANALYRAALQQCADLERTDERGLEHGGSAHEMIHPRVSERAIEMPLLEVPPPPRQTHGAARICSRGLHFQVPWLLFL
jgi:hypothetical protein